MRKSKMGGDKTLRLFLKGDEDLTASVFGPAAGDGGTRCRLGDLIRDKYRGAFELEVVHERGARADIALQQAEGPPDEEGLRRRGLNELADLAARQRTRIFEGPADVVVFSLQANVQHRAWRHRESGILIAPSPTWEEGGASNGKQRPADQFAPAGFLTVEQFTEAMLRLIGMVKERLNAHVLVYNCSSIDPDDHTHNYHGLEEDTVALRVHRLNLALMELSQQEGISIIDVERLLAEIGGERHVLGACRYSEEAYRAIGHELLRVLEDIGFFEKRPLVMQIGQKGKVTCS